MAPCRGLCSLGWQTTQLLDILVLEWRLSVKSSLLVGSKYLKLIRFFTMRFAPCQFIGCWVSVYLTLVRIRVLEADCSCTTPSVFDEPAKPKETRTTSLSVWVKLVRRTLTSCWKGVVHPFRSPTFSGTTKVDQNMPLRPTRSKIPCHTKALLLQEQQTNAVIISCFRFCCCSHQLLRLSFGAKINHTNKTSYQRLSPIHLATLVPPTLIVDR